MRSLGVPRQDEHGVHFGFSEGEQPVLDERAECLDER